MRITIEHVCNSDSLEVSLTKVKLLDMSSLSTTAFVNGFFSCMLIINKVLVKTEYVVEAASLNSINNFSIVLQVWPGLHYSPRGKLFRLLK